jgi:hypothetical protein
MTHEVFSAFRCQRIERKVIKQRCGVRRISIITTRGTQMGKRGPKRKEGIVREPNGRFDRRTAAQRINDANLRDIRQEQAVVLAQPHRRGNESRFCSSALGRFCLKAGCSKETYSGVEAYAITHHRWLVAIGKPPGFDNVVSMGSGDGPSPEQIGRWRSRLDEVEKTLVAKFPAGIVGLVVRLAVDDLDLTDVQFELHHAKVRNALGEIGICTGFLDKNPHPF